MLELKQLSKRYLSGTKALEDSGVVTEKVNRYASNEDVEKALDNLWACSERTGRARPP